MRFRRQYDKTLERNLARYCERQRSAEIDGDDVEIGFNNKYLTDALRVADTDEVNFKLNGPVSPIIILPPEGDSFLFLVLPVRIKTE